jgi:hypothetical protein
VTAAANKQKAAAADFNESVVVLRTMILQVGTCCVSKLWHLQCTLIRYPLFWLGTSLCAVPSAT